MTLKEYLKSIDSYFKNNEREYEAIKLLLIEKYYHSVANFYLSMDEEINEELIFDCNKYLNDFIPVQYILGYQYFFNLKIGVNSNVLIPRYDTEVLVEKAIEYIKKYNYTKVLDICTGSGAIALAIKKNIECDVIGSDISKEALDVAIKNSKDLNIDVRFIQSDILEKIDYDCDLIVSNPPYISYNEYVDDLVLKNEPHLALFADNEGLVFYERILKESKEKIKNLKMFIFEIGYKQAQRLKTLQEKYYPQGEFEVIKDYSEKDRVVIIKL